MCGVRDAHITHKEKLGDALDLRTCITWVHKRVIDYDYGYNVYIGVG